MLSEETAEQYKKIKQQNQLRNDKYKIESIKSSIILVPIQFLRKILLPCLQNRLRGSECRRHRVVEIEAIVQRV
jgi:hypothetical protein